MSEGPNRRKQDSEAAGTRSNPALLASASSPKPDAANLPAARRLRVAKYEDPFASLRRQILRIALVFVVPIISIIALIWIVVIVVTANLPTPVNLTNEGQTVSSLPDVPLPSGLRPVNRDIDPEFAKTSLVLTSVWVPNYDGSVLGTELFNSNRTISEISNFYDDQLVKKGKWQLLKRSKFREHTYLLYGRGTNNPKIVDGLFIDMEQLTEENINSRSGLLDSRAKIGDNIVLLFKQRLIQRT